MKRHIQAADSIRFCVRGRGAQRLLGQAAQAGLKLERIAPQADGFTAVVSGAGWAKLCQLAGAGGWQVIQMQRRGPGPLAERLLRRPGILAGIGLFFVLLHWLGGFLWCMNLELLTVPQQESIRTLLAQSGIWEGCRPSQAELAQAQQLLEAGGDFGWVSLNFTGGCLTAEGTPLQQAHAEPPAQNTGLYARAGGEVLAVNIASGFAQVQPGQYVGNGMLLAAAEKLDRSGASVPQPASGTVTARVRLAYTGQQAFTQQRPVLTGACAERRTLTLLDRSCLLPGSSTLPDDIPPRVRWLPLRLGRLALPGCVQETTCWARETQEQTFTPETAAALARRSARLQLLQDYPDAVIESERDFASTTATAAVCRAVFVFCANIAEPRSATAASG